METQTSVTFEGKKPSKSDTLRTQNPGFIHIVHDAPISSGAKFVYGTITCNSCCWHKVRQRFYAHVLENRVEQNTPLMHFPGLSCCLQDVVSVTYFDKIGAPFKPVKCGTHHHLCCCIEWAGEVAATAPYSFLNCILCPCCRTYIAGLDNAEHFCEAFKQAHKEFNAGNRLAPTLQLAPAAQTMEK